VSRPVRHSASQQVRHLRGRSPAVHCASVPSHPRRREAVNQQVAQPSAHAGVEVAPAAVLEAVRLARRWAPPAASAQQAGSWLPGAPVTRDAVVAPGALGRPLEAEREGAVPPAEQGAAEVALRAE
jgi:hypothetical protein